MNKGIFGFPRNAALQAKSVTAQTVSAQTLSATSRINAPGSSASNTGIKLLDESDLGALFRPASYTAVQSVAFSHGGAFGSANCNVNLSGSVSGSQLNLSMSSNCNCNCDCTSCP